MTQQQPATSESEKIGDITARLLATLDASPRMDDSAVTAKLAEDEQRKRRNATGQLLDVIGQRYSRCRLNTFRLSDNPNERNLQQAALSKLASLESRMAAHVAEGGNVILYGPPGTGKDHLLVGLLFHASWHCGISANWVNGQDLYGNFRDAIGADRAEGSTVRSYIGPAILAISDPVPPKGTVRDYSAEMLYRIVDARYRQRRSTWITVNVTSAAEAREQLSGPIFDRLLDSAVTVFCNWPSYRASHKPEWMTDPQESIGGRPADMPRIDFKKAK